MPPSLYRKGGKRKEKGMGKEREKDEEAHNYFPVLTVSLPKSNVFPKFILEGTVVLRDEATCPRSQSQEYVRSQHLNQVCKFCLSHHTGSKENALKTCLVFGWSPDV